MHRNVAKFKCNSSTAKWTRDAAGTSQKFTLSAKARLLIGGSAAFGLSIKCRNSIVVCEAGRLTGYSAKSMRNNETVAFDWKKFWHYLKPHILKFLAAICVNSVCVSPAPARLI